MKLIVRRFFGLVIPLAKVQLVMMSSTQLHRLKLTPVKTLDYL